MAQPPPAVQFTDPEVADEPVANTTGHVDLLWDPEPEDGQWTFELQGAGDPDFEDARTYYQGADERSFLSGLAGGDYFFRIRTLGEDGAAGPWSETLAMEVRYVHVSRVQLLMILGAVCLAATLAIILGGSLRTRRELQTRG
ncbi:MAG: hypothetical protein ACOC4K_03430 [Verrucomicrobiota bacterium]